jgi:hypothetical protein
VATYLTTTGKQYLATLLTCASKTQSLSCSIYFMNMASCAVAGDANTADTGLIGNAGVMPCVAKTTATCEYLSAVDTWGIIGTVCSCGSHDVYRAGAYWMSSSGGDQGLFISGYHTGITGLIAGDQVQYTITLQFT